MKQTKRITDGCALLALAIGLIATLFFSSAASFAQTCKPLRSDILRLHILANSDSAEDQRIKLAVRDKILSLRLFDAENARDRESVMAAARDALDDVETAAREVLAEEGGGEVHAELVRMYFTTRVYENVTLPAGYYDAVRVTIGEGAGHNWWCVLYPPLCIPAAEENPLELLSPEEEDIVTGKEKYEVKFFLVELYESICSFLFGE